MVGVDHHLLPLEFALFVAVHQIVGVFSLFVLIYVIDPARLIVHHHYLLLRLRILTLLILRLFVLTW